MNDAQCPFSIPISGQLCQCTHARLADRRSGKMICIRADEYRENCIALADVLKHKSRFVLGLSVSDVDLIHAQLMKILCGGLLGMQRVLKLTPGTPPNVLDLIAATQTEYGEVAQFPFGQIIKDIQAFTYRKKLRGKS